MHFLFANMADGELFRHILKTQADPLFAVLYFLEYLLIAIASTFNSVIHETTSICGQYNSCVIKNFLE